VPENSEAQPWNILARQPYGPNSHIKPKSMSKSAVIHDFERISLLPFEGGREDPVIRQIHQHADLLAGYPPRAQDLAQPLFYREYCGREPPSPSLLQDQQSNHPVPFFEPKLIPVNLWHEVVNIMNNRAT